MEDDEDSRSVSPSPSPSPSRSAAPAGPPAGDSGRFSVTVAGAAPPRGAAPFALALPVQIPHPSSSGAAAAAGREDCWSDGATTTLLSAWSDRFLDLDRGSLSKKHWYEVAEIVNSRRHSKPPKSEAQCKNRIDTLKKRYKNEKAKLSASSSRSSASQWLFFGRLDHALGPIYKPSPPAPKRIRRPSKKPRIQIAAQKGRAPPVEEEDGGEKMEDGGDGASSESSPPPLPPRPRVPEAGGASRRRRRRAEGMRELAMAVARFGEVYERVEKSRMAMAEEVERRRESFAKEMEMQRMEFFAKARKEIGKFLT